MFVFFFFFFFFHFDSRFWVTTFLRFALRVIWIFNPPQTMEIIYTVLRNLLFISDLCLFFSTSFFSFPIFFSLFVYYVTTLALSKGRSSVFFEQCMCELLYIKWLSLRRIDHNFERSYERYIRISTGLF